MKEPTWQWRAWGDLELSADPELKSDGDDRDKEGERESEDDDVSHLTVDIAFSPLIGQLSRAPRSHRPCMTG